MHSRRYPAWSALHPSLPAWIALCLVLPAGIALADEGMWPTYALDQVPWESLRSRGLQLTAQQIYNPAGGGLVDAVVQLGATASFVSPQGLLVTNHHVAFGAVQEQSTAEHNFLHDGFSAPTMKDEIAAPGYTLSLTTAIEDVTKKVLAEVKDEMTGGQRFHAIDRAIKGIVAETEKDPRCRCRVVPMFGGRQYIKYTNLELRDIRIVYIPPNDIGDYGGETDNWMWPRHTGDFAFLRAYVAPDGSPAEYSPKNVPCRPKVYLPISAAGIDDGTFTMTIGFPGRTERYISSPDLENQIDFVIPNQIRNAEEQIRSTEEKARNDSSMALRTAESLKGIYNRLKKNRGLLEGFQRTRALEQKRQEEAALTAFLARNPRLQKEYGQVLPELGQLFAERRKTQLRDSRLGRLERAGDMFRLANDLYRWSEEREKPDLERDRGFQARDTLNARRRLQTAQTNLVPTVDQVVLLNVLRGLLDLPADQKVAAVEDLVKGTGPAGRGEALEQAVEKLYAGTRVGDLSERLRMFSLTRKQLLARKDPMIQLAAALAPELEAMRERDREFEGAKARLDPLLVQAYAEWKNGSMYPDANGTMRVSFGQVKGYEARDAVNYHYHTLLTGVMQKDVEEDPFVVPPALRAAWEKHDFGTYVQAGDNDVPVDFLTTNDITNGNSGSPVLNGKGEIVGLAFDGNYESVASDYMYEAAMNRTIVVDSRYILFLLDKVYHLDALKNELTIR